MNYSESAYSDELMLFSARNTKSHFVFNTITAIEYLFRHDTASAQYALSHFTSYLRMNMDTAKVFTLIPLKDEIKHCLDFIALINIRYKSKIVYNINIDDDEFMVPPLCISALVENAFKHGISKIDRIGNITIDITHLCNSIVIEVTNDGPSYNNEPFGNGLSDLTYRLRKYLNADLSITGNNDPNSSGGTTATITIPL